MILLGSSCTLCKWRQLRYGGGGILSQSAVLLPSRTGSKHKAGTARVPGCASLADAKRKGVVAAYGGNTGYLDRVISAASYVLPLLDGMQYGRFIFAQYPASQAFFEPLFPILRAYSSIPFSNFVAFFTLYLAVVRNPRFGRFVRFNAMQACVMDVLLVIPIIVQRILSPRAGIALDLLIVFYNTIFVCLLVAFAFGVLSCLLGRIPRLPIVADAADNQLY